MHTMSNPTELPEHSRCTLDGTGAITLCVYGAHVHSVYIYIHIHAYIHIHTYIHTYIYIY